MVSRCLNLGKAGCAAAELENAKVYPRELLLLVRESVLSAHTRCEDNNVGSDLHCRRIHATTGQVESEPSAPGKVIGLQSPCKLSLDSFTAAFGTAHPSTPLKAPPAPPSTPPSLSSLLGVSSLVVPLTQPPQLLAPWSTSPPPSAPPSLPPSMPPSAAPSVSVTLAAPTSEAPSWEAPSWGASFDIANAAVPTGMIPFSAMYDGSGYGFFAPYESTTYTHDYSPPQKAIALSPTTCAGSEAESTTYCGQDDESSSGLGSETDLAKGTVDQKMLAPPGLGKNAALPSLGSDIHGSGECRPCAWFYKPVGCESRQACAFCHLCPESALKHRKKQRRVAQRQVLPMATLIVPSVPAPMLTISLASLI